PAYGEVVFNTSMTGYQEILTDPSYRGQIVALTYPLIGNYGVNPDDVESGRTQVSGFVVKEMCESPSNFRVTGSGQDFLDRHGIVGIQGVDVRALTKRIRVHGVMMGAVSTEHTPAELLQLIREAPGYENIDYVKEVSTREAYQWDRDSSYTAGQWSMEFFASHRVVVVDYGVKFNILRSLRQRGCEVIVVPCSATLEDLLRWKPSGVLLSNGPGDPALLHEAVCNIRSYVDYSHDHRLPIMGICLGHQLLGAALGGRTFKLKFGHRGSNHPVKDVRTGRVYITSQNHGYAVAEDGLPSEVEVSHLNLNDRTVEGLRHRHLPIFSVQYHPEASPGPRDSRYLFDGFVKLIEESQ
ncbi:MAG: glutamine-hydrolyzing carbamoyl-phosphate synthase small subunit, partial [Armatimonadetes bacterium]|nr:glutamine-hydrolyzing carbamoyl-phosphate synthase small subunit [Armatimonadota bacterium]